MPDLRKTRQPPQRRSDDVTDLPADGTSTTQEIEEALNRVHEVLRQAGLLET